MDASTGRNHADEKRECEIEALIYDRAAWENGTWSTAYALLQVCKRLNEIEEAIQVSTDRIVTALEGRGGA
jgi:hypothetical protein